MTRRTLSVALLVAGLALGAAWAGEVQIQKDVVYGQVDGVDLKLDIVCPDGPGPFPLVVCIHGGAWRAGSKLGCHGWLGGLVQKGYVAAAVEYRFCPQLKFPAQVEDVKCAVRFLRAHAKDYKIDPAKVAAMGDSAGGHLSLLLGLMDPADGLEGKGGSADQSSKVQAVVNWYGPTDFSTPLTENPMIIGWVVDFLGTKDPKDPIVTKASPIAYVNKGDPPVLTIHGSKDPIVSVEHAKRLHEALKKAKVTERMEIVEGGDHGGFPGPEMNRLHEIILAFLDQHLKGAAAAK